MAVGSTSPFEAGPGPLHYQNEGNLSLLALVPHEARRILDIGCGAGNNAEILRERGHRVWGLTVSSEEATVARSRCEDVWVGDVETMSFPSMDAPFDALLMSHVLEHLVSPTRTLARLAPLLAPGALLLAAVPNMGHWRVRWRVLMGDWRREGTGFFDRTHLQFWTFETFRDSFVGTPFEVRRVVAGEPGLPLRPLRRLLPGAASWLDEAVGRTMPNLASSQVLLVAQLNTAPCESSS